jgi:hypothetical protein
MSTALSIRISPEIQQRLERETARLKTTKSQYVQELLEQALLPKDPIALLMQVRKEFGIPEITANTPRTDKASNVKKLVKEEILKKHGRSNDAIGEAR